LGAGQAERIHAYMRAFFSVLFGLFVAIPVVGQIKTDTLYYDKDWKGVESKAFASFYRVVPKSADDGFRKQFRDYYITGELQSEGGYVSIDKYDDSKSVFDGEYVTYFKSGKIEQKGTRVNGVEEGEYVKYDENGLILLHAYLKKGKPDGILTQFSEDGNICVQIEYSNGEPAYDWYMVSNKDGLCSKIRLSDKQPIYENPSLYEKKQEYRNGEAWPYYNKNGIMVGMTNNMVKDYGKYFQIPIVIANNSMFPIEFDPSNISATLIDKKGESRELMVYSADEYMKKVRRKQNWAMALNGIAEGLAAAGAGYSSSTTNSSYSGNSYSYGSASAYGSGGYAYGNYSGNTHYNGHSTSTTTSYNGAAAYQAQVIASNRMAAYEDALLSERAAKDEGYLKRTTIQPGETISGYVNIERKKGSSMTINVNICGAVYVFPWNVSK